MNEGDLLVDSELVLPARPELGVGERTRRITTVHTGPPDDDARADGQPDAAGGRSAVFARIAYEDDAGPALL